jgi:hypothetical protein
VSNCHQVSARARRFHFIMTGFTIFLISKEKTAIYQELRQLVIGHTRQLAPYSDTLRIVALQLVVYCRQGQVPPRRLKFHNRNDIDVRRHQ